MQFVLTNSAGKSGIQESVDRILAGGRLLDLVEGGIRMVEEDPQVHSVGPGSWPNLLGAVELDASIMDGTTRESGAVGALQGCLHPISVARKVMEKLPHAFLVGEGAARFAREVGAEFGETLTAETKERWREWLRENATEEERENLREGPLSRLAWKNADPIETGTTIFIALDGRGNIASGVSTSGWAWKYPGRLGDSPVIGAGNYCDSRYGAAGCIGHGELAIRSSAAKNTVNNLRAGMTPEEACRQTAAEMAGMRIRFPASIAVYAVDKGGEWFAAGCGPKPEQTCNIWREGMPRPEEREVVFLGSWEEIRRWTAP